MGGTDFITGQPVVLEVGGALVEFPAVLKADAVDDQVAVQVVGDCQTQFLGLGPNALFCLWRYP